MLTGTLAAKSDETERTGVDVELEFSRERTIGRRTDRTGTPGTAHPTERTTPAAESKIQLRAGHQYSK